MSEDSMVSLVAASESEVRELAKIMGPLRNGEPAQWLKDGVNNGQYEITTVIYDGQAAAVFWSWFSGGNKALIVNAAGSLRPDSVVVAPLLAGLMVKAKQCGAASIEFQTARRGLIQKMRRFGFKVEGVCLSKVL